MAARPSLQDATKTGLMKAELLLDRFGSQPDLPADLPLSCRTAAVDQRELDMIGLIEAQPVEIAGRERLAAAACRPEFLHRTRQIDGHDRSPEMAGPATGCLHVSDFGPRMRAASGVPASSRRGLLLGSIFKTTKAGSPY